MIESYKEHIELTMSIGCKSMCSYCPQETFISQYKAKGMSGSKYMTLENLKNYMMKVPRELIVSMAGFSEPLNNPEFLDIYKWLIDDGRHIDLNTTLFPSNREQLRGLLEIGLEYVQLHVPDADNLTKIKVDREYLSNLRFFLSHLEGTGTALIVTCLGKRIHEDVESLLSKYSDKDFIKAINIGSKFINDRTGNVTNYSVEILYKHEGPLYCSKSYRTLNFANLLPNGDLALCCMDWSLENILGNLEEDTYDVILNSEKANIIREKMKSGGSSLICSTCSMAVAGEPPEVVPEYFRGRELKTKPNPPKFSKEDL